jgi:hypothetical protein
MTTSPPAPPRVKAKADLQALTCDCGGGVSLNICVLLGSDYTSRPSADLSAGVVGCSNKGQPGRRADTKVPTPHRPASLAPGGRGFDSASRGYPYSHQ